MPSSRLLVFAVAAALLAAPTACRQPEPKREPIKVGLLHSLTGPFSLSERPLVDAEILAIEQINAKGGVLGRKLDPVVVDGGSDSALFADKAKTLLTKGKAAVIIGTWASANRKAVIPVVDKYRGVMFYPAAYEGLEESKNLIYTGGTPNQQTIPAVRWFLENRGRRFFLVGSDNVWARTEHASIKDSLKALGGRVIGEEYLPEHRHNTARIVAKIAATKPDVVVNTLSHGLVGFFHRLHTARIDREKTAVFSLAVGEDMLASLKPEESVGSYAVWTYFQSLATPENRRFVAQFKKRYGAHRRTDDAINNAYLAVNLWARAARDAGSVQPAAVLSAAKHQRMRGPEGQVWVDEHNRHLWRKVRIGRVRPDGQFEITWTSETLIRPEPYPVTRTREAWRMMHRDLFRRWGGRWFRAPDTP